MSRRRWLLVTTFWPIWPGGKPVVRVEGYRMRWWACVMAWCSSGVTVMGVTEARVMADPGEQA